MWIRKYYHKNPHQGLDGLTPEVAFKGDKRALRFVDAKDLAEAFLHTESRKVDKTGCISFGGKKYDVGMKLIGRTVEVHYDPTWTNEIEIHHKDFDSFNAKVQIIGDNCGTRQSLPEGTEPLETQGSRMLKGLNRDNTTVRTNGQRAVSYSAIGGQSHV